MALTIRDAESSYLTAHAQVEAWKEAFLAEWLQPEIDLALVQLATKLSADPVTLAHLKDMTPPDQWRAFEESIKQAQARLQNGTGK